MVLDNASATDGFVDSDASAPASDNDPYSSSDVSTSSNLHIDASQFPRPMPILGPLFGFGQQTFSKMVNIKLDVAMNAVKRPLTQDEGTALAYWTAKQISIFSYGPPLGVAAGWWRAYGTASTFRFPFWQPNLESFRSNIWPPRLGLLKGQRAVVAWHTTRMLAYSIVGNYVSQILFGSYSMTVSTVGELLDPRLKSYVEAVRKQSQQRRGQLSNQSKQPDMVDGIQQKDATALWEDHQRDIGDDASSTGGSYGDKSASLGNDTDGSTNEDSSRAEEGRRRSWPHANSTAKPSPTQMGKAEAQSQPFDVFDDVSLPAGQGIESDTRPAGSAWERIRRGENTASSGRNGSSWPTGRGPQPRGQSAWSKQQNAMQREQREGSATDDSFTFSKSDEERSLAKDEAQKEFDARVERERRGGDFSSGSGDQK